MARLKAPRDSAGDGPEGRSSHRILVVYPIDATFIQADLAHLRAIGEVVPLEFRGPRDYLSLLEWLPRVDVVYCWFALEFAAISVLLAKLIGRKSIVVAGGWDVTGIAEIEYGRLLRRRGRLAARLACGLADLVLAFSDWSVAQVRQVAPGARVRRAYLSVDPEAFRPGSKEDLVVCVAHVSRQNVARKGLRTFVRAANLVPEARFLLVGRSWDDTAEELRAIAPSNVTLTGWLEDAEFKAVLARAKVYCQASFTEGFGVALAEAMASGCVPVVCRAGAIPEVVGDTGLYVPYGDERSLAAAIHEALQSSRGMEARDRVHRLFSSGARREEIRIALQEVGRASGRISDASVSVQPATVHQVRR